MTKKWKRILGAVLLVFLLAGMSATALAVNVTDHDLYDWFEYYRDGAWHDLNTVMYFDTSSGNVGYCVEHEAKPPRESIDYTPFDPATMFTGTTMTGIQAILNHGFPPRTRALATTTHFMQRRTRSDSGSRRAADKGTISCC